MEDILVEHDMKLNVWACSCCANPEIQFWYKGKKIVDSDSINFKMVDSVNAEEEKDEESIQKT